MKKILLMLAIAASLFMGSTVFAHNAHHGSGHGYNHGHNYHGQYRPHKIRRARPPRQHCHQKRVRRPHGWYGGHRKHGHRRHFKKWVTYCHVHRGGRRGHGH